MWWLCFRAREYSRSRRAPWPTRRPARRAAMVATAVASVATVAVAATSRVRRAQTIPRFVLNEHRRALGIPQSAAARWSSSAQPRSVQLIGRSLRRKGRGATAPLLPHRLVLLLHIVVAAAVPLEGPVAADAEDQAASEDDLDVLGDGQPLKDRVQHHDVAAQISHHSSRAAARVARSETWHGDLLRRGSKATDTGACVIQQSSNDRAMIV